MIGLRAIIARPTLIINEPSLGKFFTRQELQKLDDLATFRNVSYFIEWLETLEDVQIAKQTIPE